jgi:hypothetical protein
MGHHFSPTIGDVPELLRLNGDEVGVVMEERGKLVGLRGRRLRRLRGGFLISLCAP